MVLDTVLADLTREVLVLTPARRRISSGRTISRTSEAR